MKKSLKSTALTIVGSGLMALSGCGACMSFCPTRCPSQDYGYGYAQPSYGYAQPYCGTSSGCYSQPQVPAVSACGPESVPMPVPTK